MLARVAMARANEPVHVSGSPDTLCSPTHTLPLLLVSRPAMASFLKFSKLTHRRKTSEADLTKYCLTDTSKPTGSTIKEPHPTTQTAAKGNRQPESLRNANRYTISSLDRFSTILNSESRLSIARYAHA